MRRVLVRLFKSWPYNIPNMAHVRLWSLSEYRSLSKQNRRLLQISSRCSCWCFNLLIVTFADFLRYSGSVCQYLRTQELRRFIKLNRFEFDGVRVIFSLDNVKCLYIPYIDLVLNIQRSHCSCIWSVGMCKERKNRRPGRKK